MYWKRVKQNDIYLAIYVDDLLIASSDIQLLENDKAAFATKFAMHDMGEASFILGMKITRDRATHKLCINQDKNIPDILIKYGMNDCKNISTSGATDVG